ncbi:MAG: hypothetical protein QW767_03940 [Thermoprotei archaeon]
MNADALIAVAVFAAGFCAIYFSVYWGALKSYRRGELEYAGLRVLKLGFVGQIVIFAVLAVTALLV